MSEVKQIVMNGKAWQPTEFKVLVLPDETEETDDVIKRAKASGMELPKEFLEKQQDKQVTGTIIAVGGRAFEDFNEPNLVVGATVYYNQWAGKVWIADDKTEYRLILDKDISAVAVY